MHNTKHNLSTVDCYSLINCGLAEVTSHDHNLNWLDFSSLLCGSTTDWLLWLKVHLWHICEAREHPDNTCVWRGEPQHCNSVPPEDNISTHVGAMSKCDTSVGSHLHWRWKLARIKEEFVFQRKHCFLAIHERHLHSQQANLNPREQPSEPSHK